MSHNLIHSDALTELKRNKWSPRKIITALYTAIMIDRNRPVRDVCSGIDDEEDDDFQRMAIMSVNSHPLLGHSPDGVSLLNRASLFH